MEEQQPTSLDAPVSSGQLLRCLSSVLSLFLNNGIASEAVFVAAHSLGVTEEDLLAHIPTLTRSKPLKGGMKKEPVEGKKEKKERKPHKLSMFNIFMAKMMLQQRLEDEANGGGDAKSRLQRCSTVWKNLPETEKEKFRIAYGPLVDQINAKVEAGQVKADNLQQEIKEFDSARGLPTTLAIGEPAADKPSGKASISKGERPQRQATAASAVQQNGAGGEGTKTKKGKKGPADVPASPVAPTAQEAKGKKRGADAVETPKSAAGKDEKNKKAKKAEEEVPSTVNASESSKKKKKKKKKKDSEA